MIATYEPDGPIPVAVAGATGGVGQRFVSLLEAHPWFELVALAASEHSAGRPYGEVVRWSLPGPLPARAAGMEVLPAGPDIPGRLVFSALDAAVAGAIETELARGGKLVVSNAKSHRMDPAVPLLVPEVNPGHLALCERQDFGAGRIVTNPNCSTIALALALKPLCDAFGLRAVHVVTLQALSGAGLSGPTGFEMTDNVIPYIEGEEPKIETETLKVLGELGDDGLHAAELRLSATCNRVPVVDGHTLCVSVELGREADAADLIEAWSSFRSDPQHIGLPSAPARPTLYLAAPDAPQPRRHRDLERGMATVIGRLRRCPVLQWKFVALGHNTLRGAAGGSILAAELAVARGCLA